MDSEEDAPNSALSSGLKTFLLIDIGIALLIWATIGTEGIALKTCQVGADKIERFEKICTRLERKHG